jgi:hypothetical protein
MSANLASHLTIFHSKTYTPIPPNLLPFNHLTQVTLSRDENSPGAVAKAGFFKKFALHLRR